MAPERDATFNSRNGGVIDDDGIVFETALDWFRRSQTHGNEKRRKRRRRNGSAVASDDDEPSESDSSDVDTATDPSMAAWRFLRFGKSGIAPIDVVWKNGTGASVNKHRNSNTGRSRHYSRPPLFLPPITVLEGPKDVGKTWMLLTLAARFVVATRASRFETFCDEKKSNGTEAASTDMSRKTVDPKTGSNSKHENEDKDDEDDSGRRTIESGPKVLLLDSTHDFSVSQLVNVVRSTLARERQRERIRRKKQKERQPQRKAQNGIDNGVIDHNGGYNGNTEQQQQQQLDQEQRIEKEFERQERDRIFIKQDMEDCLSRIHIIQVDNGPTGWVPMLEALTYELSEDRRRWSEYNHSVGGVCSSDVESTPAEGPPTLLLWDGFLSDMALSSNAQTASTASVYFGDTIGNISKSQALFDSPGAQELLRQLSRLLQKELSALWLVLATRTVTVAAPAATNGTPSNSSHGPATTEQSGIGARVMAWIRKEEESRRRRQEKDSGSLRDRQSSSRQHHDQPQRASYRLRLDRRSSGFTTGEGSIPRTAAAAAALFAKVAGCGGANNSESSGGTNGNRGVMSGEKIPYSISLGGILS